MRTQLSLYVPSPWDAALEAVRRRADPVQARLIPAHVTLCRDEELAGLTPELVGTRVAEAAAGAPTLAFGRAERFDGHGILLPCVAGAAAFHDLRRIVLGQAPPREPIPHLTLAHPRNPCAPGNSLDAAAELPDPLEVRFTCIHWIEQQPGAPWVIRATFGLPHG